MSTDRYIVSDALAHDLSKRLRTDSPGTNEKAGSINASLSSSPRHQPYLTYYGTPDVEPMPLVYYNDPNPPLYTPPSPSLSPVGSDTGDPFDTLYWPRWGTEGESLRPSDPLDHLSSVTSDSARDEGAPPSPTSLFEFPYIGVVTADASYISGGSSSSLSSEFDTDKEEHASTSDNTADASSNLPLPSRIKRPISPPPTRRRNRKQLTVSLNSSNGRSAPYSRNRTRSCRKSTA
ncbi:hypothetical protein IWQ62_001643 [Dispira parvispora]|uniref:Uncharacterized protein n=1 Tax=Dispira parvispora TaxID=1520584 RepID=A0A9W8E7Z0_9FUNG|nr:hypothetical protein IWQ62_001643 [Dispira parvispora]